MYNFANRGQQPERKHRGLAPVRTWLLGLASIHHNVFRACNQQEYQWEARKRLTVIDIPPRGEPQFAYLWIRQPLSRCGSLHETRPDNAQSLNRVGNGGQVSDFSRVECTRDVLSTAPASLEAAPRGVSTHLSSQNYT